MIRAVVVTLATLLLLLEASQAFAETLTVTVTGMRGAKGTLFVTVWHDEAHFLKDLRQAAARRVVPVSGPAMTVVVEGLPKGIYAVTAFQDENGNGVLDRSFIGLPTEPVGTSNDARGMMGPPKFRDAAFALSGPSRSVPIRLR